MKRWIIGVAAFAFQANPVHAGPIKINFDGLKHNDTQLAFVGQVYQDQGFTLTANDVNPKQTLPDFRSVGLQAKQFAGATTLFQHNSSGEIDLTRTDGGAFRFSSIDLAELPNLDTSGNPFSLGPFGVTFSGVKTDGSTVSETVTVNGFSSLQTDSFHFFDNVTLVYWFQGGGGASSPTHQFDNLVLEAVPEPASVTLLCIGIASMAGYGWRRRWQK